MSVPVEVVDGIPCVVLPSGRKKEPTRYEVRPVPPVGGWRSWAVEQVDDATAEHHHTVGTDGERWRCTCRDHLYRGRVRPCKHVASVREVLEFYRKLTGVES